MQVDGDLAWQGSQPRVIRPNHWAEIMGAANTGSGLQRSCRKSSHAHTEHKAVRGLDMAARIDASQLSLESEQEHTAVSAKCRSLRDFEGEKLLDWKVG
jgi:hypothetical protein